MLSDLTTSAFMLIGYLVGSIPTGYLIARALGVDIQKVGSGNIGATNVLRALGPGPALAVALLDPLKGYLVTVFPLVLGLDPTTVALTGFATVLGNNFNIFLRLRGGKGIATSLGVFFAVEPLVSLMICILGLTTMALGRLVSLGSLVGVLAAPLMLLARGRFDLPYFLLAVAIMVLSGYKHRENIRRLMAGTERRLGERVAPQEQVAARASKESP